MRIPRIYYSGNLNQDDLVQLDDNAARHVGLVLRLETKDKVVLFNGDGVDYLAEIIDIQKKKIFIKIIEKISIHTESELSIHLGQAISRGEKMDWVIQKAVELGVNEITPVITQYTQAKASEQKLEHWRKIIISSCEQCGRNKIPTLHEAINLSDWLNKIKISENKFNLIFEPEATMSLGSLDCFAAKEDSRLVITKLPAMTLLIGPEGGFSSEEITLSQQYCFQSVKLGNRILRTETAAIAAISALQTLFGDFR